MKKLLLFIVLVIVVVAVVLGVAGHVLLASVLGQALGAPAKVGKLHLGLTSSELGIYGVEIQNPAGFDEKVLASVPEIFVSYDLSGIFSGALRIKEVRLNLDQITVERSRAGKVNLIELAPIQAALKAPRQRPEEKPEADQPEARGPALALQIDEVHLSLGRARYVDNSAGKAIIREFPLEVKDTVLRDVTDPSQIVQQIVFKTLQKVGLNALVPDWSQFSSAFKAQAVAKVEEMKTSLGGLLKKMKLPGGGESSPT